MRHTKGETVEYLNSLWQVGVIALAIGALVGALAYRYFSPSVRQSEEIKSQLDHAKRELSNYKASVNSHFEKTSELVNDLTQNYVKVYQHLAEGAQTLGNSRELNKLLEQQQGKVLLTVGDETGTSNTAATSNLESSATSEGVAEPLSTEARGKTASPGKEAVASNTETTATAETAGASIEEGGEPLTATTGEETAVEKSTQQAGESGKPQTATATEGTEDAGEPVLDVDKIKAVDTGESTASVETGRVTPEHEEIHKAPPTRH